MITRSCVPLLILIIVFCGKTDCFALPAADAAASVILYDNTFSFMLYQKEPSMKAYPASITKVMTAVVVLENTDDLDSTVTASLNAVSQNRAGGSSTGILEGEELTYRQLLDALLIRSGNEVSYILAEAVAGTFGDFVTLMNRKALYLGLTGTAFVNPCGLHEPDHYSTAHDLLKLARYAMSNEVFASIVSKAALSLPPTNMHTDEGWADADNTNLLLSDEKYRSQQYTVTGIKTGSTPFAGYCLMSSVILDTGSEVYGIVLGTPDEDSLYMINKALYDDIGMFYEEKLLFGTDEIFARLKYEGRSIPLFASRNVTVTVPKGCPLSGIEVRTLPVSDVIFPIYPDTPLGTISVSYGDRLLATYDLVSGIYIDDSKETSPSSDETGKDPAGSEEGNDEHGKIERKTINDSFIVRFLLIASSLLFLLIIFTVVKDIYTDKRRRKPNG